MNADQHPSSRTSSQAPPASQAQAAPSEYDGAGPGAPGEFSTLIGAGFGTTKLLSLDPRVIRLWQVVHLIWSTLWLLVFLVAGTILSLNFSGMASIVFPVWLVLAALLGGLYFFYPRRAYQAWGYRIDEKVLETQSGIWFRSTTLLPLSRLQHVDLQQGPLERSFGLASLILHTAGTHEATILIPGLDVSEAAQLRDQLLAAGGDDAV